MNTMTKNETSIESVKEYIFQQLENHNLKIGDRLPTEVQLSEQIGVNRSAVRDALQSLKGIGLVNSSQGSGYTIVGNTKKSFSEALRAIMAINDITFTDISEIREALEIKSAQLAIQHNNISEKVICYLNECITNIEHFAKIDSHQVTICDINFHRKIAELSDNQFLINFVLALSDFSNQYILISWDDVETEEINRLLKTHKKIIEYLEKHDITSVTNEIVNHYHIADDIIQKHQKKNYDETAEQLLKHLLKSGFTSEEIYNKLSN